MAESWYQITAAPDKLARIAAAARDATGPRHGDPVLPVGSHRIVLLPGAARAMIDRAGPPSRRARPRTLEDIVKGAKDVKEIAPSRVAELLAAREPEELAAVPRRQPDESELVIDGWDWHVKRTRLVDAWHMLGDPDGIDWKEIRVGQIDTGYRPHPCLGFDAAGRSAFVLTDVDRNFFDISGAFDPDPITGQPLGSEDSALDPLLGGAHDGHGTRTGSVLAGRDPGNQYFGAAPRVPYIPVRISDSVIINNVQPGLARAIDHLVQHGCGVITLSMGMALTFIRGEVRRAIDRAYEQGVILVTAAGNVWDPVVAPARLNRTLAIGGSTSAMAPWLGSSFGPQVDLCAPAWPVRRASVDRKGKPIYGRGDGTSFATPLVAGTAALWLRHHGEAIRSTYRKKWQWVEAFKQVLTSTAQPGVDWDRRRYGSGILDAQAVLRAELRHPDSLEEDRPA